MSKIGNTDNLQQAQYRPVTFNDSQNKKKKTIEIPIGYNVSTTNTRYEIRNDGIYSDGKKVEEIAVTLPQMTALEVFDANKDKKIDKKDISLFEGNGEKVGGMTFDNNGKSAAREINDKLARNGSQFYINIIDDEGGTSEEAGVGNGEFYALFRNGHWSEENSEVKEFRIQTPESVEAEKKSQQEANKPWWKFW